MTSESAAEKNIRRILIVRLSAMGDVIHTLPAVHALREAFPQAKIGWLIEERWAELLCAPGSSRRGSPSAARPLVDEVHTVNLKAWGKALLSPSTLQRVATVWNDVRDAQYDVAVDLQGAIRSAVLARWSGARVVYGAADPRESPASLWYSRKEITRGRHVIEQNLSVAEALIGHEVKVPPVEFPRDAAAEARVDKEMARLRVRDFAMLNPGAGWGAKRWPAERYGEVARALAGTGICPLVNYGPGEENLFQEVSAASGGAAHPMQGSITELIAWTRRARLFVGGDTGPLHLADALRIPVVAIFGPTDPARNGPYGTRSIVLRSSESLTSHARHAKVDDGMLEIGSVEVVAAGKTLLSGDSG